MMILTKIYVNDRLPMIPTTCNVNKLKKLTVQHQPILKNDALHSNQVVGMGTFRCWLEASFLCSTGLLLLLCFFFGGIAGLIWRIEMVLMSELACFTFCCNN